MEPSLSGKTVIVTGAAKGIGLSIARNFYQCEANVVLTDTDEEKLASEVDSLQGGPGKAIYYCGNLLEKLTIKNLLAATIDAFDRVDILVNASRQVHTSDPLVPQEDIFEQMLQQNVILNLRLAQAVAKRMIQQAPKRERGEIIGSMVNISSIAAERTLPELNAYSVSIGALNQLTRSLAVTFAGKGIRVNAVAVGSIMSASLHETLIGNTNLHDRIADITPLGRIGEAGEAADAALFLASNRADFITGQVLTVDGGRSLIDVIDVPAH